MHTIDQLKGFSSLRTLDRVRKAHTAVRDGSRGHGRGAGWGMGRRYMERGRDRRRDGRESRV